MNIICYHSWWNEVLVKHMTWFFMVRDPVDVVFVKIGFGIEKSWN